MIEKINHYLYKPSMGWRDAKQLLNELENKLENKKNVDDLLIKLFEGDNKQNICLYRNKTLLDSALLCFVWHRIHRSLLWDSSTEVFSPVPKKFQKVTSVIKRVSSHLPSDSPLLRFSRLLTLCIKGNYHKALYFADINIPEGCYLEYYIVGAKSFQLPVYDPKYKKHYGIPTFDQKRGTNGTLFLLSCDENYYNKFHERFVNSARRNGISNTIVFVVMGDRESVFYDEVNDFYKIVTVLDIEYSPALFASARFLFLRDVINKFKTDVLVFDIDFDFSAFSLDFLNNLANSDIALSFNKYGRSHIPWSKISAAACYFSGSSVTDIFLNAFCFYFENAYAKDRWWIDQNALFYAYNTSRGLFPSARFANIIDVRDKGVTNHLPDVVSFKRSNLTR